MANKFLKPDYVFEVSWEVCNKVGGIHTVIATKAKTLEDRLGDHYILIGPDVWKGGSSPEFIEDTVLFKTWKELAFKEGLKIRIGRWKIAGNPIVILVDFTSFFVQKNEIFANYWVKFQLDSLTGGWDYVEPALFGYAAAKVIECYYRYHLNNNDKIVAQFHEWMTGMGILYIEENVPQIATVFTTHATVLGRAIAGSGVPFYSLFNTFIPEKAAVDFDVVAKHSLEKVSANFADAFTTVSEITAKECEKFLDKTPDAITHNGFDNSILPNEHSFDKKRMEAREKIVHVVEALLNQYIPDDVLMVVKSGRYEFRNKGIDIFINSLALLKNNENLEKTVLGIIFVPGAQTGPRKDLIERIGKPDYEHPKADEFLTHYLQGVENDSIMKEIDKLGFHNLSTDKVKIIFVPTYLDGFDGIFNLHYYDLLIGFDLAIFPSYYEPFGYTPLESIAHHIPTIATSVSGFGVMIAEQLQENGIGINIINRTDTNEKEVATEISRQIFEFSKKSELEILEAKDNAYSVSKSFLWDKLITQYEIAYRIALNKTEEREDLYINRPQVQPITSVAEVNNETSPIWRTVYVETEITSELSGLHKLAKNLWWLWNYDAEAIWEFIDPLLWKKCGHNPILLLRSLSFRRIIDLSKDKNFLSNLNEVEKKFDEYMAVTVPVRPRIAYFSMEYGLGSFLKLYSGGLGVLAGDYLKEASDNCINISAIGIFYKHGFFRQKFTIHGEQIAEVDTQDFSDLPLTLITNEDKTPLIVNLYFPGRKIFVQVWKLDVGRISLYLLDTDIPQNSAEDRNITAKLYDATPETRLKQEILLGFGGIRALKAMGLNPDVCHCNEGHASFINIERIHNLIKEENLSFEQAVEVVKSSSLFTTHTSVPAAFDLFSEDLLRIYLSDNIHFFNIEWEKFIGLGRINAKDSNEKFSMTYLGSKLSQEINAVSKIHRDVSRKLLNPLWKNFNSEELHIGSVTNGVHYYTWVAKEWQHFFHNKLGIENVYTCNEKILTEKLNSVEPLDIWNTHLELKRRLISYIKLKINESLLVFGNNTLKSNNHLNENTLIVGFARRFVTYKRSGLLFKNLERLAHLLQEKNKPVIFVFAGKAHPNDGESIKLITQLIDASVNPTFKNSIIFLEDYNMDIGRLLTQGVDVWLNTPYRHTEASGTSGMKAAMNGVLNFSVLDGWWAEAYNGKNGWMLSENPVYNDNELQNQLDTEVIYNTIENEIVPLYYNRDENGCPVKWIEKMKSSISTITPQFNMRRCLLEYNSKYYTKLYERVQRLKSDNFALTKNIAAWKKKVISHWNEVDVISIETPDNEKIKCTVGEKIKIKIVLDIGRLSISDVGVELLVVGAQLKNGYFINEFSIVNLKGSEVAYEGNIRIEKTGNFDFTFRIFPKNVNLAHRQDFDLIKWV